jgi:hypothetical protein
MLERCRNSLIADVEDMKATILAQFDDAIKRGYTDYCHFGSSAKYLQCRAEMAQSDLRVILKYKPS